jgi:mRNA interferase MazF
MVKYRWNIYWVQLDPVVGSEQAGVRPVIVISSEVANQKLPIVTVLPLTSVRSSGNVYSTEVFLKKDMSGLSKDSIVMAHQIRTISKKRLGEQCGNVSSLELQRRIQTAVRKYLALETV